MNTLSFLVATWCLAVLGGPGSQVDAGHALGVNRAWLFGKAWLERSGDRQADLYSGYWPSMEDNPTILFPLFRSDVVYFLATRRDDGPSHPRHYLTSFRRFRSRVVRLWQVVLAEDASHRRLARPHGAIARLLYERRLVVPRGSDRRALRAVARIQGLARYEIAMPIDCVWCWCISPEGHSGSICEQHLGNTTENLRWLGFRITPGELDGLRMRHSAIRGEPARRRRNMNREVAP